MSSLRSLVFNKRLASLALGLGTVASLALGHSGLAAAAELSSPACGTDNLLAGKLPWAAQDLRGDLRLITDQQVGPEGAQWDAPVAVPFETGAGTVTYDLGQPTPVSAFVFQGDANDTYKVLGSLDTDPASFKLMAEIENVVGTGHGLRTRVTTINPIIVRYLRINDAQGDGFYSIAEFGAYCQPPNPFPPHFKTVAAPPATVAKPGFWSFAWWDNDASSRVEMVLAALACALVGWGVWLARRGMATRFKRTRDALLMAVGVLAFCAYWNFFAFHFGNYYHVWDAYHYYVGSKYFKELSYDRLYECGAVADSEDPAIRRRVELRKIMNLRTNMLESTAEILAHPERCKSHFTPERWEAFKKDITYFRLRNGVKRWEDSQGDHGYNATPVWNIVGSTLANMSAATEEQLQVLIKIDPFFIIGAVLMTLWAYGWRTACVAMAVFATCFPCRFYWTGGAFLRWDWIFYFVGGVCLVRKEKPMLGGFFLGYAALLRVFPGFCVVGPLLVVAQQLMGTPSNDRPWWKPQPAANARELFMRVDRRWLRFFGGLAIAGAVLIPISLVKSNGIASYVDFYKNSQKHNKTPLTNYMGLKTVMIYRPWEAGSKLKNDKLQDPWGHWKEVKFETGKKTAPLLHLAQLAFLVLLWRALRGVKPWVALSMGTMFMAIIFELTCYYYSFVFVVALLYEEKEEIGAWLLGAMALTGFFDWGPLRGMSHWLDEQYTAMSAVIVAAFVWILYRWVYPLPALLTPATAGGPPIDAAASDDDEPADKPAARASGKGGGKSPRRKR
jgi:hypothetical protein